jgi:hypothetical protein
MLMLCFCLVGFTVGRHSVDVYLKNNEAIYISRWDNDTYVWVYTYDAVAGTWDIEPTREVRRQAARINVHFVEPLIF